MSDLRRIAREEERESEADLLAEAERAAHVEGLASMKCPFCAHLEDKVVDSREARTGDSSGAAANA